MTKLVLDVTTKYVVLDGEGNYEELQSHSSAYNYANFMTGMRGVFRVIKNGPVTASLGAINLFEFMPFGDMGLFYVQQAITSPFTLFKVTYSLSF